MELNQLLKRSIEKKASDVHLSVGLPPVFRINGELVILEDKKILPQDAIILTKQCLTQKNYETFFKTR